MFDEDRSWTLCLLSLRNSRVCAVAVISCNSNVEKRRRRKRKKHLKLALRFGNSIMRIHTICRYYCLLSISLLYTLFSFRCTCIHHYSDSMLLIDWYLILLGCVLLLFFFLFLGSISFIIFKISWMSELTMNNQSTHKINSNFTYSIESFVIDFISLFYLFARQFVLFADLSHRHNWNFTKKKFAMNVINDQGFWFCMCLICAFTFTTLVHTLSSILCSFCIYSPAVFQVFSPFFI